MRKMVIRGPQTRFASKSRGGPFVRIRRHTRKACSMEQDSYSQPSSPNTHVGDDGSATPDRECSFFSSPVQNVRPVKTVGIKDVYNYITLYMPASKDTHTVRSLHDATEARKYKACNFDFVCFSGTFSYRADNALIKHSGLLCLDFDHIGTGDALWTLRRKLIADPYFTTWLLFTSPSGDGLKWVIDIDLGRCDHSTWFKAVRNYIMATYRHEVDKQCANISRSCFLPHDSSCYVHPSIIITNKDICPF